MKKITDFLIKNIKSINFRELGILYALLLFWAVLLFTSKNFLNIDNMSSILRESAFVGIAAIGMTFCIITKGIDLSVGSMLAMVSVISVSFLGTLGLVASVILVILLGTFAGMFNGILIVKLRIPPFIATLGTYFIYRSLAYIYTNGNPIQFKEKWFTSLGNGDWWGIPSPFVIFIVLTIIGTFILRRTPLGRYILAVGNSEKACNICGIKTSKVIISVYTIVGIFVAFSAFLTSSRLWSANPAMKDGFEFDVIAAVVMGGTALSGGKGSVFNTFISSIFFATINNVMNIFHVDPFWQYIIKGFILLLAFSMTSVRQIIEDYVKKIKSYKKILIES